MPTPQGTSVEFKADPLRPFLHGTSPIATHVRHRWCGKPLDKSVLATIARGQGEDGSWGGSVGRTIEALYAWHLLGKASDATLKGINWLMETHHPQSSNPGFPQLFFRVRRSDVMAMSGVPFTKGCSGFVKSGAAIFLAGAFGQGDKARLAGAFGMLDERPATREGRWCSAPCSNNIFLGYSAHPKSHAGKAMRMVMERFEADQTDAGGWPTGTPFYPTLSALSRLKLPAADRMIARSLNRIRRLQKLDGSWGDEINGFLVLDALERKRIGWRVA